jgi:hypothetical protein
LAWELPLKQAVRNSSNYIEKRVSKYLLKGVKSLAMNRGLSINRKPRTRGGSRLQLKDYCGVELEQLKKCLLFEHKSTITDPNAKRWIDRAADEAASLAWATTYPLLVFPVLLEEKVAEAALKARRQRDIFERTGNFVALAA